MKKISSKQEGTFAIVAAFIVLFSSMLDPIFSVAVSIVALLLYGVYKLTQK